MSWKLYALTSGGGMLAVTYLLSHPLVDRAASPTQPPEAVSRTGPAVDLAAEADRLRTKLSATTGYSAPERNAFQFRSAPSRAASATLPDREVARPPSPPPRPPFGLAGMAITAESGGSLRTAILSSLQGVVLAKEGDVIEGGYRVAAITDDSVTLESTADGRQATLRLAGSDVP